MLKRPFLLFIFTYLIMYIRGNGELPIARGKKLRTDGQHGFRKETGSLQTKQMKERQKKWQDKRILRMHKQMQRTMKQ